MSRTIVVTRHQAVVQWLESNGLSETEMVSHFTHEHIHSLRYGDVVIGILPLHILAILTSMGVRYLHVDMNVPPEYRGMEITAEMMDRFGAKLSEYEVILKE